MSKSTFYTVWFSDDSQADGQNYIVCTRPELISFLRSGRVFERIESFNVRTIHEHVFASEPSNPNKKESNND